MATVLTREEINKCEKALRIVESNDTITNFKQLCSMCDVSLYTFKKFLNGYSILSYEDIVIKFSKNKLKVHFVKYCDYITGNTDRINEESMIMINRLLEVIPFRELVDDFYGKSISKIDKDIILDGFKNYKTKYSNRPNYNSEEFEIDLSYEYYQDVVKWMIEKSITVNEACEKLSISKSVMCSFIKYRLQARNLKLYNTLINDGLYKAYKIQQGKIDKITLAARKVIDENYTVNMLRKEKLFNTYEEFMGILELYNKELYNEVKAVFKERNTCIKYTYEDYFELADKSLKSNKRIIDISQRCKHRPMVIIYILSIYEKEMCKLLIKRNLIMG